MQKLLVVLLTVLALLGVPAWSQAQGAITATTITEPVTVTTPTTITVASATGISAGSFVLIDNELARVAASYVSGTAVPILRGTRPTTHRDNSALRVFPIAAILNRVPTGSCTRGEGEAQFTLSVIAATGAIAVCRGGGGLAGGVAGNAWMVTDISGAEGVLSDTPPTTP